MKIGKIEYLNLAPFDAFAKKFKANSSFKKRLVLKQSYPSLLNKQFFFNQIDSGFISSIAGYKSFLQKKSLNAGIIADGEVFSVLMLPRDSKKDYQSSTSNALSEVLDLKGEVIIGDKALKHFSKSNNFIDMGLAWKQKTKLPFVFGLFCYRQNPRFYKLLISSFIKSLGRCRDARFCAIKLSHQKKVYYAKRIGIDIALIDRYLKRIYYKIDTKELLALKRFYYLLRIQKIKIPNFRL